MPAPGDQHQECKASANPFEEAVPRIHEFTARQIAVLQSKLDRQLGPEYISSRPGAGGGKVHYITAEKVINLANEVFGFNGWSSSIQNITVDFIDPPDSDPGVKISLGLSATVRITLRDGTYHEDIGYGHIENCKGKAAAFEKCKKEAVTDAMKRSLRNFGNVLGNCLYDKDFLQKVTKVKATSTKFDPDQLHRHPDYAPVKKEAMTEIKSAPMGRQPPPLTKTETTESYGMGDDEFGDSDNLFNDMELSHISHPDEVVLYANAAGGDATDSLAPRAQPKQEGQRMHAAPTTPQQQPRQMANSNRQAQPAQRAPSGAMGPPIVPHSRPSGGTAAQGPARVQMGDGNITVPPQSLRLMPDGTSTSAEQPEELPVPFETVAPPQEIPAGVPTGFVRVRPTEQPVAPSDVVGSFNPHAETPSIRRTALINSGKSQPIKRSDIAAATGSTSDDNKEPPPPPPTNFVNPGMDPNRKIGMPMSRGQSPVGAKPFKAHSVKRAAPGGIDQTRQPLTDMSNGQSGTAMAVPGEAKKPKLEGVGLRKVEAANGVSA